MLFLVCKTWNQARDTTRGGAGRPAPLPAYRKRAFTTHADRLRPRLQGGRLLVAGPAARCAAGRGRRRRQRLPRLRDRCRDDRPGLDSCMRARRAGDVLVVWKLARLGRNLAHSVNTVQTLSARGVGLRVLTGQGAQIDTTTATPPCPRSAANLGSPPWRSTGTSGRTRRRRGAQSHH